MKCFAVLFFALLIERSLATECCSNNTLDIASIQESFDVDLDNITVPPLECGDRWSGEFKNSIGQAIRTYVFSLLADRLDKARHLGDELNEKIEKAYERINHAIGLISQSNYKTIALEKAVRKFTNQCWKFLELRPGNGTISNPPVLPYMPVLPIKLETIPTELSAEDIFLHGDSTIRKRGLQTYGWMAYVYYTLSVIRLEHRGISEMIREQINDEVLNCSVMGAYKRIVIKALEWASLIRSHVSPDTWEYFKDATDRILDISKAYCEALKLGNP